MRYARLRTATHGYAQFFREIEKIEMLFHQYNI